MKIMVFVFNCPTFPKTLSKGNFASKACREFWMTIFCMLAAGAGQSGGAQLQEPCPVHFHYFYLKEQEVSNKLPTFHILFLSNLGI